MTAPPAISDSPLAILKWHKAHTPGFTLAPLDARNDFRAKWLLEKSNQYRRITGMMQQANYFKTEFEKLPDKLQATARAA